MWKINYQKLIMMNADAVRYVKDSKPTEDKKDKSALGYFQSRLNDK